MAKRRYLIVGGVLMVLLGLARGAGGLVLLLRGAATDPNIRASASGVAGVGVALSLLGLVLIVAAVGVLRRNRRLWLVGMASTVAFVIDGAINGYVLYGRPGIGGTLANGIAAALILACLLAGRRALRA